MFLYLFWNHVLTCVSDSCKAFASSTLSGVERYLWLENLQIFKTINEAFYSVRNNLRSKPASWASENTVLAFLLLPGFPRSPLNKDEKWNEDAGFKKNGCDGSGLWRNGFGGMVKCGKYAASEGYAVSAKVLTKFLSCAIQMYFSFIISKLPLGPPVQNFPEYFWQNLIEGIQY